MKKFLSAVAAALLLSVGFVSVSGEAQAAPARAKTCKPSQYVECKPTSTQATGAKSIRTKKPVKTTVTIRSQGGGEKPRGKVTITITGPGGFKSVQVVNYNGRTLHVTGPRPKKPGTYTVTVKFNASNDYKDSTDSYKFKVKK